MSNLLQINCKNHIKNNIARIYKVYVSLKQIIQNIFTTYKLQFYLGKVAEGIQIRVLPLDLQNKNFQTLLTHDINNLEASIQHLMLQLFYQSLSRSWVWVKGERVEGEQQPDAIWIVGVSANDAIGKIR